MKINLNGYNKNIRLDLRNLGYFINENGSFSRRLGSQKFPRFHIYYRDNILNIHLDQKPGLYKSANDHSAEYDSKIVTEEVIRIKKYFKIIK